MAFTDEYLFLMEDDENKFATYNWLFIVLYSSNNGDSSGCGTQVDGVSLEGFSNEEAVDVLRRTGHVTGLKLARHRYGSKYEQLLHAAAVG